MGLWFRCPCPKPCYDVYFLFQPCPNAGNGCLFLSIVQQVQPFLFLLFWWHGILCDFRTDSIFSQSVTWICWSLLKTSHRLPCAFLHTVDIFYHHVYNCYFQIPCDILHLPKRSACCHLHILDLSLLQPERHSCGVEKPVFSYKLTWIQRYSLLRKLVNLIFFFLFSIYLAFCLLAMQAIFPCNL